MKILVIDDNTTIRETLAKVLVKEGNKVEQAHDGDAAMAMISTTTYDLAIIDMMLPGLDGATIARRINSKGNGTKIVMISAWGSQVKSRLPDVPGEVLQKPIDLDKLKEIVAEAKAAKYA